MELTSFAAHAAAFLLSVSLRTVLIFAAAGLVCLGLRRASAASRHLLWAVTLVSLLCLPVFCVLLPPLAAPVLPPPMHQAVMADDAPPVQASIASPSRSAATPSTDANFVPAPEASQLPADDKAAAHSVSPRVLAQKFNASEGKAAPTASTQTQPVLSLSESKPALSAATPKLTSAEWLLAIWLIGMTLVLSRTMLGLLGAVRLVRRSVAVASGPLAEAAGEARRKLGLKTLPSVRDGSLVAVPMTFGILRPIVLVPAGARDWPAERLQAVMLHEMGHIKRRDWGTAMLAEVVCALYWFHPLVWLAARQLRAESEQACDDLVLTSGIPPAEYADHLLEVVRGLTKRRGSMPAVVTMACKQDITARIKTILATSRDRRAATGRSLMLAMLLALVIVLPLAAITPEVRVTPSVFDTVSAVRRLSPFAVALPDGTQVALVAVIGRDTAGHITGRWAPNGGFAGNYMASNRQNLLTADIGSPGSDAPPGTDLSLRLATSPPRRYHISVIAVSAWRRGFRDFDLALSSGPYTTLVGGSLALGGTHRLSAAEIARLSHGVTRWESGPFTGSARRRRTEVILTLPVRFTTADYDSKLEAVGPGGQSLNFPCYVNGSDDGAGATRKRTYGFNPLELAAHGVIGFRFVCRPAAHFTFHGVALEPASPSGGPASVAARSVSQTFDPLDPDPAVRARARQQRVDTALHLRALFQPWAARNAALLLKMRRAQASDLGSLLQVYRQVPPPASYLPAYSSPAVNTAAKAEFCALPPPPSLTHLWRSSGPQETSLREDFARYRDLRLSHSINTGRTYITLWVSGRVTETTLTDRVVGHRRVFAVDPRETAEVAPIYPILETEVTPASLSALQQKQSRDQTISLSNLHQIGLAVFHYAAAHDEHFPDAAHWMDQIIPYLVPASLTGAARQQRIAAVFHSPSSPAGQKWSYAYNRALSGLTQREIDAPNQIVAVFESSRGVRNASDGGQSVPNPGWHQGGSVYVFTDAHVRWFGQNDASRLGSMFIPVIPAARREIPIRGQVFDSRTRKPVIGTWVIFSKSPDTITAGSVWPSSFTDKAGRFQSMVYPVKNYLMVLENNRFKFAGKTVSYEANGNKGSISTQGTKAGPPRAARSDYIVHWTLPQGYGLSASQGPDKKTGANITAFTPIAHSAPR